MKKLIITAGLLASVAGLVGCGGASGEDPGDAYMPDMYYSRAYETYGYNNVEGEWDSLKNRGIFYNAMPVNGTIARGESMPFHYVSQSDSGRLAESNAFRNPLDTVRASKTALKEAERLYLVNCGICHGTALDGNGPLYNNGNGPFPVLPKSLVAPDSKAFTDGHYFHVITYGIRAMGSYASQLTPEQRWWVIKYIRAKQGGGAAAGTDSTATATPGAMDTTKKG
ncbi:MAG: c-type cytochrome [Flavisolibacter sp.]